jgi:hypothetical protein
MKKETGKRLLRNQKWRICISSGEWPQMIYKIRNAGFLNSFFDEFGADPQAFYGIITLLFIA